jgi:hypothetical protein
LKSQILPALICLRGFTITISPFLIEILIDYQGVIGFLIEKRSIQTKLKTYKPLKTSGL